MKTFLAALVGLMLGANVAMAAGWAALAAGSGNFTNGQSYSRAGIGWGDSQREAEDMAKRNCRAGTKLKACQIRVVHNYGCAFAVTGQNRVGSAWATGYTPAEALQGIAGYVPDAFPIGGCFIDGIYVR